MNRKTIVSTVSVLAVAASCAMAQSQQDTVKARQVRSQQMAGVSQQGGGELDSTLSQLKVRYLGKKRALQAQQAAELAQTGADIKNGTNLEKRTVRDLVRAKHRVQNAQLQEEFAQQKAATVKQLRMSGKAAEQHAVATDAGQMKVRDLTHRKEMTEAVTQDKPVEDLHIRQLRGLQ